MSRFIGQSLPGRTSHCNASALHVIDAELGAGVHAEIEFGQIPVKVILVDVLEHSDESALEDREEAFEGVCASPRAHSYLE